MFLRTDSEADTTLASMILRSIADENAAAAHLVDEDRRI